MQNKPLLVNEIEIGAHAMWRSDTHTVVTWVDTLRET